MECRWTSHELGGGDHDATIRRTVCGLPEISDSTMSFRATSARPPAIVDGKTDAKPVPRFDRYCTGHRLATLHLVSSADPNQIHDVTVEIHLEQPDRPSVAFRLKDPETELKAPKYQGTRLWVGQILLLGDLVE
jgi:hypothetical protein